MGQGAPFFGTSAILATRVGKMAEHQPAEGEGGGAGRDFQRSETRHAPRTSEEEDGRAPTSKGRAREARSGGKKADR